MRAARKTILIAMVAVCAQAVAGTNARAEERPAVLLLLGGPEADVFKVSLSTDGTAYVITSGNSNIEAGGSICWHPEERATELNCKATAIAGFEVDAGDGNDLVELSDAVPVPATLRGDAGNDTLVGGKGDDKLLGGDGLDHLYGGEGNDLIRGGAGFDIIRGNLGDDELFGEGGHDSLGGGGGDDSLFGGQGADFLYGGTGNDRLVGGEGRDSLFGGPGDDRFIHASDDKVSGGPGQDVAIPGGPVS
jgi:Ca2+-binding RTX toxin-like protein